MFELPIAATLICALVGIVFFGLWMFYDRREHAWFERERRKTPFHCIRCDQLYAAAAGLEVCPCPRCAHPNSRLRF